MVYYQWDWGDGSTSQWLGPYNSGVEIETKHTWEDRGDYEVKVRAKDTNGLISDWSDPLPISMPKGKMSLFPEFHSFIEWIIDLFPFLEFLDIW